MKKTWLTLAAALTIVPTAGTTAEATRIPVLGQVAHPHTYYWREMYMPQLTSGPSAATFSPDGKSVIYSMQGSLWRQAIDDDTAYELTTGPGYDYQPDWSPDGRFVVFSRQHGNALNLILLDLDTGAETALTTGDDVNLEPRFSPDGSQLAYVSTKLDGYFGIHVAGFNGHALLDPRPLVAGRVSEKYRYYYSQADHAINPAWGADGDTLYYVSNPETSWGTGDIWATSVSDPSEPRRVFVEETTWAARPQPAHDGKRLLYASYRGRQWHQLWLTGTDGNYPLPLTFGEYDIWQPRWSPDDQSLIYITNEDGGLALYHHTVIGGARHKIEAKQRVYKRTMQTLEVSLVDDHGKPLSGRVSVKAADGRHYAPVNARIHADDYLDPVQADHETHYFHCARRCSLSVPVGPVQVQGSHGFRYKLATRGLDVSERPAQLTLRLDEHTLPTLYGSFTSADMHVHMNYGGKYKQDIETMSGDAAAEGLDVVYNLIVNKEERIPDIGEFTPDKQTHDSVTVYQGQEYHTSYWGHLGLLHLDDHILTPDFASYWHTGLASAYPTNAVVQDLAHAQGAVTGYVHPFGDTPNPADDAKLTHSLPVDAALGKTDYLEIVSFADHQNTASVWYRLLNLGFHIAAGAGTDAMTNYASLRGPIGLNRIFLDGVRADQPESLKSAIRSGHGFVSNGPLIGLLVNEAKPGMVLMFGKEGGSVRVRAALRSPVPVERFELVINGQVSHTFETTESGTRADADITVPVHTSGWMLVRAVAEKSHPFVQDIYTYATTNPVWLTVEGKPQRSANDAAYFIHWLDRIAEHAAARTDYNYDWERAAVLADIAKARKIYEGKQR
ncbi:CehA/McbA family metallohydrolase [Kordiimonas aestuarii]|uniref:CehA/McbA family metallohydrolase n=1 Tax=Kordiimonas aestuarii TaxID=1005925 RepID=UPI0021CE60B5|nr:CehA/McbA family metallohydrolase [Kordiimonas aestuarii]